MYKNLIFNGLFTIKAIYLTDILIFKDSIITKTNLVHPSCLWALVADFNFCHQVTKAQIFTKNIAEIYNKLIFNVLYRKNFVLNISLLLYWNEM